MSKGDEGSEGVAEGFERHRYKGILAGLGPPLTGSDGPVGPHCCVPMAIRNRRCGHPSNIRTSILLNHT
jgi:hypothetical protein